MAKVEISDSLEKEINKKFKNESIKIFDLMYSLENNPKKGKLLAHISNIAIKELKYGSHRFYFITDNYRIRFMEINNLNDLLIRFVRMSDKKDQQKTIDEIKKVLRNLGEEGF